MYVESLLVSHVVYISTIHELSEGSRIVIFTNILRYYMAWDKIVLWGGSSEDMDFGAVNFMFEFSNLMHIMVVLSDNYVGLLITELILSLIHICSNLWGRVNTKGVWWGACGVICGVHRHTQSSNVAKLVQNLWHVHQVTYIFSTWAKNSKT